MTMPVYNKYIKSYFAGFVDGEGCISVVKSDYRFKKGIRKTAEYSVQLDIGNTNEEILKFIQKY